MRQYMMLGAVLAALVSVSSVGAQEAPAPQPDRPQTRARLHAPGAGLRPGMIPMRQWGRMGQANIADRAFAPRALIDRRAFLGLSDQQVAELEELEAQMRTARDKALTDAEAHREALAEAWNADKPDVRVLRDHATALMRAHQEAQLEALSVAARAKAGLTPEQLGKARGLQEGRRARVGARGRVGAGRGMRAMPRSPRPMREGPRRRFRRPELL